jgi:hydroxymethylbilane synthase
MCPAVGQGALAIETNGGPAKDACARLDDPESRTRVTAERAVLAALGGGCQVPIGASASIEEGELHLLGVVVSPDGARVARGEIRGDARAADALGREVADLLLERGARQILNEVYGMVGRDSAV